MITKKLIPLSSLLKKAQMFFNAWIRERDKDKGCISCGSEVTQAGHYFSQGHNSSLRFNEVNVNAQCVRCNCHMHGNLIAYRQGLVNRYGEEKVLWLENTAKLNRVRKWSRTELEAIIKMYSKPLIRNPTKNKGESDRECFERTQKEAMERKKFTAREGEL